MLAQRKETAGVPASGIRSALRGRGARQAVEQLLQPRGELVADMLSWPTHAALLSLTNYHPCQRFVTRSASASEADGNGSAGQVVEND